jgi:hypothetical protein
MYLDADGNPAGTGEWLPIQSFEVTTVPDDAEGFVIDSVTDAFKALTDSFVEFTMQVKLTAEQMRFWNELMEAWDKEREFDRRRQKYLNKCHGPAPRRKNKHGRKGVRR